MKISFRSVLVSLGIPYEAICQTSVQDPPSYLRLQFPSCIRPVLLPWTAKPTLGRISVSMDSVTCRSDRSRYPWSPLPPYQARKSFFEFLKARRLRGSRSSLLYRYKENHPKGAVEATPRSCRPRCSAPDDVKHPPTGRATTIRRDLIRQQVLTPTQEPGPGYDGRASVLPGAPRASNSNPLGNPA